MFVYNTNSNIVYNKGSDVSEPMKFSYSLVIIKKVQFIVEVFEEIEQLNVRQIDVLFNGLLS